jgi:protein-serine/threonine kinase
MRALTRSPPQAKKAGLWLGVGKARHYGAEIIAALAHVHELKIVHRDLKPGNVMLTAHGHVKLLDFGLGRRDTAGPQSALSLVGTPKYVAPEILHLAQQPGAQTQGSMTGTADTRQQQQQQQQQVQQPVRMGYGKAVDYWSLGCMIYEMLLGRTPFEAGVRSRAALYAKIMGGPKGVDIGALLASKVDAMELDAEAADLLRGLLRRDPGARLGGGADDKAGLPRSLLEHGFFASVDWKGLLRGEVPAPWAPSADEVAAIYHGAGGVGGGGGGGGGGIPGLLCAIDYRYALRDRNWEQEALKQEATRPPRYRKCTTTKHKT